MADAIHSVLSQFRDSILGAVATLEFRLRDLIQVQGGTTSTVDLTDLRSRIEQLETIRSVQSEEKFKRLEDLIQKMNTGPSIVSETCGDESHVRSELMKITKPTSSNVLVPVGIHSIHVISAAPVPSLVKKNLEVIIEDGDQDGASHSEVTSEKDEEPSLEEFDVDGVIYYKDDEHAVYEKTGEGEYEQVGQWDPNEETLEFFETEDSKSQETMEVEEKEAVEEEEEDEEEEEEEEEELECEEFEYNGTTYLRDTENKVYTAEGELIGLWNGKRIRPVPSS